MADLNVTKAKERLDKYGILIIDEKHAKIFSILNNVISEKDLTAQLPIYEDRAGYFKGTSGGGISDELNVRKEFQRRFYKEVIRQAEKQFNNGTMEQLIIMCPEEDISLLKELLSNNLQKALVGFIKGNYIKVGINDTLEKALEIINV